MKLEGKKVGKHAVTTPLHQYDLDVRLVVRTNNFVIYAPNGRRFSNPNLATCKQEVEQYLREGDVTSYTDVIEYKLTGLVEFPYKDEAMAGFDFRVARVSTVLDGHSGCPRLEKDVEVDAGGKVVEHSSLIDGTPYRPSAYRTGYDYSIPFTTERYRKCWALRKAIVGLKAFLKDMLEDDAKAPENLDREVVVEAGIVFAADIFQQRLERASSSTEEWPTSEVDAWTKACRIDGPEWSGLRAAVQLDIRRVLQLIASMLIRLTHPSESSRI